MDVVKCGVVTRAGYIHCFISLLISSLPVYCAGDKLWNNSHVYTWTPVHDNHVSLQAFRNNPWVSKSLKTCIVECFSRILDCNSIRYNKQTQDCQAGFGLLRFAMTTTQGNAADEVIYSKTLNVCDHSDQFTLTHTSSPLLITCLRSLPIKLSYGGAERKCRSFGGQVFALRDTDRLRHISVITDPVYIGLRKETPRGDYYWSDGSVFARGSNPWNQLWGGGEPSGMPCVILGKDKQLYSVDCAVTYAFICEVLIV